ncbi:MAG: tetratricopeptide repeat protein [Phycisphaerales bacterium]
MASKVNTKFVVTLGAVLVAAFVGVTGLAYVVLNQTGETHANRGDKLFQEGKYEEAAKSYARAVGHERGNVEWLRKWREALVHWVPPTEQEYNEAYRVHYMGILRQLATVQDTNPDAQRDLLQALYEEVTTTGGRGNSWELLATLSDQGLKRLDPNSAETKKVRRYRGLAQVYRMRSIEASADQRALAKEDLQAAVEVDPSDVVSHLALVEWITQEASRERRAGRVESANDLMAQADAAIKDVVAAFPNDPRALLDAWQIVQDREMRAAATVNLAERRKVLERLAGDFDVVVAAAEQAPPSVLSQSFLGELAATLAQVKPADASRIWLRIVEGALAKEPESSRLMLLRAVGLAQLGEHQAAIDQYQQIVELPDLPVSLEGMRLRDSRLTAMEQQIERTLSLWESASPGEKPALMERAKARRADLAAKLGSNTTPLLRIDGMIAALENRHGEAVRHFAELDKVLGGADVSAIYMLAAALQRSGSDGAALQAYDRILRLDENQVTAMLQAAEIERRLERPEQMKTRLVRLLQLDPENDTAKKMLAIAEAAIGGDAKSTENLDDPVIKAMFDARRLMEQSPPDPVGAARVLDAAMEKNPDDPRLVHARIVADAQQGLRAEAIARAKAATERWPENRNFRGLLVSLEVSDPVEAQRQLIAESDAPELEKQLALYGHFKTNRRNTEASAALAEAAKLAPDDRRVIEFQFIEALEKSDLVAANDLAGRAARANIDEVNGLTYQARIEMVEKKFDAAASTLDRAIQMMPFEASTWKLLGQAQISAGKVDEGLKAYQRAAEYKPDDASIIRSYVAALMQLQRADEALRVTRQAVKQIPGDLIIAEAWLQLEEQIGNPVEALDKRKLRRTIDPSDRTNNISLARLLVGAGQFQEAQAIIDSMPRTGADGLVTVLLDARLSVVQGDADGGIRKMRDYIAGLEKTEDKLSATLALGDLLMEVNKPEEAVAMYTAAREFQVKSTMDADRRLGDVYFQRGAFAPAAEAYEKVLAAGADRDELVSKRYGEVLIRLERWADARKIIEGVESRTRRDVQTAMLLAEAAIGERDMRRASDLMGEAAQIDPANPLPLIRRSQVFFDDDSQYALVMRDLDQVIRLRPDLSRAREMRAELLFRKGRESEAAAELRAAVEAAPNNFELRQRYIKFLASINRCADAQVEARAAADKFGKEEPAWHGFAADIAALCGDTKNALTSFQQQYNANKSVMNLTQLVNAMLASTPPQANEALQLIDRFPREAKPEEVKGGEVAMMLLRAVAYGALDQRVDAEKWLTDAWVKVKDVPEAVAVWFDHADRALRGPARSVDLLERNGVKLESLSPPMRVMVAIRLARVPEKWPLAMSMLEGIENATGDPSALLAAHRVRGQVHYFTGEYAKAVESYRAGLKITPDDPEFNNNLAYTLARHLGDVKGALPFAEKAAVKDAGNSGVLDTLGWLHMEAGNLPQADEKLTRALQLARTDEQRIPALVHLAQLRLEQGKKDEARTYANEAKSLVEKNPVFGDAYKPDLDQVMREL